MLQLNHRCLILNCFNRLNKNLALHFNFSPNFLIKIMNDSFHLSFELQLFVWGVVFFFFDSWTVISYKSLRLLFPRKTFLLCIGRESNPGLLRGRRQFYHWTTDALFYTILIVLTKFYPSIQFFFETSNKIMKNLFRSNWGWVQLSISVVSSFLTVDSKNNNATADPSMLDFYLF